jgi:hypothetical protein
LTYVLMESCIGDNRRSVVLFLSFPKCPISLILVIEISSYELAKWNDRICPHLGRDVFFVLFGLVNLYIKLSLSLVGSLELQLCNFEVLVSFLSMLV